MPAPAAPTAKEKFFANLNRVIKAKGETEVNPDDYDMTDPAPYTGPLSSGNTVIYLYPKPSAPVFGSTVVYSTRVDISTKTLPTFNKGSATDLATLLPELNAKFGIQFTDKDFDPITIESSTTKVTLKATNKNLLMTGEKEITLA